MNESKDKTLKMYYFCPNGYSNEWFVMARSKEEAIAYVTDFLKSNGDEYSLGNIGIWDRNKDYTIDEYKEGQVIQSEVS